MVGTKGFILFADNAINTDQNNIYTTIFTNNLFLDFTRNIFSPYCYDGGNHTVAKKSLSLL